MLVATHDAVATVDMQDFASRAGRQVTQQESAGLADIVLRDVPQ
jgi:hypothetical protein